MRGRRPDQQLLLVAIVFLGLASAVVRYVPGVEAVANATERALTPLQSGLSRGAKRIRATASRPGDAETLRARVEALTFENERLQNENLQVQDLKRENRQLRDELDFVHQRPDLDLMGASIAGHRVASEPGPILRSIKLDIGRADGLGPRMTVVNHRGLIGQITRLTDHWSDVMLITDPRSRVSGRIDRSGKTGMVFGLANGELIMRHIPQDQADQAGAAPNVQVGDIVETSGMSRRFPAQITIGQVIEVRQNDVAKWQEALIRPTVDFGALEVAMVLRDWVPDLQAEAEAAEEPGLVDEVEAETQP
ncbi:MAG: rod shape-determining protein MreC [Chloroflexi bacterium]|nr:rod shape-determining protein MreC [Chloroflexota bacterium]